METFKFLCFEAFSNLKTPPCNKLLSRIDEDCNSSLLNLSGIQFSCITCKAIGQALEKDIHIKELVLSNCRLSPEGFSHILCGLEKNKFLVSLNLNGNDIRGPSAVTLGKLFRHNNHIQNLYLEWNGLGVFPETFAVFCEGLSVNHSLKSIDLRSNHLNYLCAQSIAEVIVKNSNLQKLDLRWNNLGLIGGRCILKALRRNQSITALDLTGNNLPTELMESIELATSASALRNQNTNEQIARSKFLATKLQEKEDERVMQVRTLMVQLDRKEKDATMCERLCNKKLSEAEDALAEKQRMLENFSSKIQELDREVSSKSDEIQNLTLFISALETKREELISEHQLAMDREQKARKCAEKELRVNLGLLKEENLMLKNQVQDLRVLQLNKEEEISKLKEKVLMVMDAFKKEKYLQEEIISNLQKKYAETEKENYAAHQNQISRMKEEYAELEKILKFKESNWETQKDNLKEELKTKSSELVTLRSQFEEKLIEVEGKLKAEHELIKQQLEERIEILEESNKEQNDHLQSDLQALHQLKTDITSMDLDLAEQAHEIQRLKQCLAEKDVEMRAQEKKIRLEMKLPLEELTKAKDRIKELTDQNKGLQSIVTELKEKHKKEQDADVKIIRNYQNEIKKYERKIKEISEIELRRTSQLEEAFKAYLKGSTLH